MTDRKKTGLDKSDLITRTPFSCLIEDYLKTVPDDVRHGWYSANGRFSADQALGFLFWIDPSLEKEQYD